MIESPTVAASPYPPPYADRSGGLVAFGVLQIFLGLVCLGLVALLLVGAASSAFAASLPPGSQPLQLHQALFTASIYVVAAIVFVCLGIGSILARRWARTLTLILSWNWLAVGLFGLVFLLVAGPSLLPRAPAAPASPGFVLGCMAVVFFLFFVLLPGAFVLFYRSPNVQATCEAKDPVLRWTDHCPAPVLAVALGLAWNALFLPLSLPYSSFVPVFGFLVGGPLAFALRIVLCGVCAVLAWAVYQLRPAAWSVVLVLWLLSVASTVMTFRDGGKLREFYEKMGLPPQQVEMAVRLISENLGFLFVMGALMVAGFLYLLWIRRYFYPPVPNTPRPS
jgi:MFS family permease